MSLKILIVEDDFALSDNLAAFLKSTGFEVSCAPDGHSGLETARKQVPDLILLDVMLPMISGFDICRTLRSEPKTTGIKILMITGLGLVGDVEKAFSCGASDYLIKPFDTERLLRKIKKVLGIAPAP